METQGKQHTIRLIENKSETVFAFQASHEGQKKYKKENYVMIVLSILLGITFLVSLFCFTNISIYQMRVDIFFAQIKTNAHDFYEWISGIDYASNMKIYCLQYVIGIIAGASLGLAGVIYQGVLKNQLASPETLGVQSGGLVGNLIFIVFFFRFTTESVLSYDSYMKEYMQKGIWERNQQIIFVLIGCIFTLFMTVGIATLAGRHGRISSSMMILMGMLFSTITNGAVSVAQYYFITRDATDPRLIELRRMTMGSLSKTFTVTQLILILMVVIPCMSILFITRRKMNLFALGEDEARTMGMNVNRFRFVMLLLATLLTAIVMSFIGQVGFIGFIVPHMARKLVGPDFAKMIPCSILLGGLFLIVIQNLAILFGFEMYLNVITSSVGSLCMLLILLNKRRKPYGTY